MIMDNNSLFQNILTSRPEGMSQQEYKAIRTLQNQFLKLYKKKGRAKYQQIINS